MAARVKTGRPGNQKSSEAGDAILLFEKKTYLSGTASDLTYLTAFFSSAEAKGL